MAPKESTGFINRLWDFFASVKLTFVLLLVLAATSVLGTLLPQKEAAELYLREFGQSAGGLILGLGLDDAYHTPWFLLILCALAANLVVCSLNRLPGALKIIRKDPAQELGRTRKPAQSFTLAGAPADNADRAESGLKSRLGRVYRADEADRVTLFAQRGAWSRLGVYVVHFSVLIIFAGAIVGNIWGYSGFMAINEGQAVDHVTLERGRTLPLGFAVRLDKFSIKFYQDGMPSEYRSNVTFLRHGKPVKTASLIVNSPAELDGIDFYQSSYGQNLDKAEMEMTRGDKTQKVTLHLRVWSDLPGGGQAGVMDYRPEVNMGGMYKGPVARIAYRQSPDAEPQVVTAFAAGSKIPMRGPVRFSLLKVTSTPYTGLQVKYDPGVWFIWVGCTLMVAGFFIAFYLSHRKVWIWLSPAEGGRSRVEIAGGTNKNRVGLERLMLRLAGELQQGK